MYRVVEPLAQYSQTRACCFFQINSNCGLPHLHRKFICNDRYLESA